LQFIKQLGNALHSVSSARNDKQWLQLVYVIGPPHSEKLQKHDFGPEDLRSLSNAVDGFSLMTYDFSGPQNPGPNAPLKWIRSTLQMLLRPNGNSDQGPAHKIFLGINFYGNDFALAGGISFFSCFLVFSLLFVCVMVLEEHGCCCHLFLYYLFFITRGSEVLSRLIPGPHAVLVSLLLFKFLVSKNNVNHKRK
jgi:hypothetical protein